MVIADVPTVAATVNANNRFRVQCFATVGSPIGTASPMESSLQAVLPRVAFAANSDARFGSLADHVELLEKSPLYPWKQTCCAAAKRVRYVPLADISRCAMPEVTPLAVA